jgi:hypothetical protein
MTPQTRVVVCNQLILAIVGNFGTGKYITFVHLLCIQVPLWKFFLFLDAYSDVAFVCYCRQMTCKAILLSWDLDVLGRLACDPHALL